MSAHVPLIRGTVRFPRFQTGASRIKRAPSIAHHILRLKSLDAPNWPPPTASSIHPIEPWGKQLFVFSAYHGDPTSKQGNYGGRGEPAVTKGNLMWPVHPLVCVANHQLNPLAFLKPQQFRKLVEVLPEACRSLVAADAGQPLPYETEMEEPYPKGAVKQSEERLLWKAQVDHYGVRTFNMQKQKGKGLGHRGRPVIKHQKRAPKL